jgi:transcriptional regulator with XRE-family HTH domain
MEIGELLKRWRVRRSISMSALARFSQLSKATISRWESNQSAPDIPTLLQVLQVLNCSEAEKLEALVLLGCPRAVRELGKIDQHGKINLAEVGAPVVSSGELLRAMRLRSRMTLSQLSAAIQVRESTLSQWENGQRLPSDENLQRLGDVLKAKQTEISAIRSGRFPLQSNHKTLDDFVESFEKIMYRTKYIDRSTYELEWIAFAQNCWRIAQTEPWGTGLLRQSYTVLSLLAAMGDSIELSVYFAKKATDIPVGTAPVLVSFHPRMLCLYEKLYESSFDNVSNIIRILSETYESAESQYQKFRLACELAIACSTVQNHKQTAYWLDEARRLKYGPAEEYMISQINWYEAQSSLMNGCPELALKVLPHKGALTDGYMRPVEGTRAVAYYAWRI